MTNYKSLIKFSLFRKYYMYVDCEENLGDHVFINNKLQVKFEGDMTRKGTKYTVVLCSVPKKKASLFEKCMVDLERKMLLSGYSDYGEFCEELFATMEGELNVSQGVG